METQLHNQQHAIHMQYSTQTLINPDAASTKLPPGPPPNLTLKIVHTFLVPYVQSKFLPKSLMPVTQI